MTKTQSFRLKGEILTLSYFNIMAAETKKRSNLALNVFILLVASTLGIFGYQYYKKTGGLNFGFDDATYTTVPEEMKINYVPADFDFEFNDENAVAILSNPHRYHHEFDQLVYNFNMALLGHVANRMDLPDSLKMLIPAEYDKHHSYLKQLYFNDFTNIRDTTANIYESWYNNEGKGAVEAMQEVAGKYTCFMINHVMTVLLKSTDGKFSVTGRNVNTPCGIAMTEGLAPMIARLQQRAAINDFSRSKGIMEEKIERVIAELATMEIRDKKGISKQLQTKIWGFNVSSTDIEISAISVLKVGFRLNEYFHINMDSKRRKVKVTLPEPTILSHEVYPKVDKMDIGWMREVNTEDFNKNFNVLRAEFRKDAYADNVMEKAKTQAEELMQMMLGPLVASIGNGYDLEVNYRGEMPVLD